MSVKPPDYIANFDSATAMLRATASYLHGRDFPALGLSPLLKPFAARANLLPRPLRRQLYIFSGWNESLKPNKIDDVDAEEMARWAVSEYPDRSYPAMAIGSSSGAAVHLYAAMGIPWLPQTMLVPVRQAVDPDKPKDALAVGKGIGRRLLANNPDLQLHHMHDANQDRLMVRKMTYFRVKRRRLGEAYRRFIERCLPPGGTLFVMDCRSNWRTTRVGDRHVFQHGAIGGATEEEFHEGSPRVRALLDRVDAPVREWDEPEPDTTSPEAEWGYEPALDEDLAELAERRRYKVRRIVFDEADSLSPLVADLYRWWYRQRGIPGDRLLIESFVVMEPWWALRTGSVPFWMTFNMRPDLQAVHRYLDRSEPYEHIHLMLFNHGADAVGLPEPGEWRSILRRARTEGTFIGADPPEFPMDYAQFSRYHTEVQKLPGRYPMPQPLGFDELDAFLDQAGEYEGVQVTDGLREAA